MRGETFVSGSASSFKRELALRIVSRLLLLLSPCFLVFLLLVAVLPARTLEPVPRIRVSKPYTRFRGLRAHFARR